EYLGAQPLLEDVGMHVGDGGGAPLRRRRLPGPFDRVVVDPLRLGDQQPPRPRLLLAGDEHRRVVGPPEPFQGADHEIPAQFPLAGGLDGVGDRIQRFDRFDVAPAGVGVSVPLDGDEPLDGYLDQLPGPVLLAVGVLRVLLDVVLRHLCPMVVYRRIVPSGYTHAPCNPPSPISCAASPWAPLTSSPACRGGRSRWSSASTS